MKLKPWIAVIAALGCTAAQAADSIQLNKYVVTGTYALDPLNGTGAGISGLEASAVTYARDRGTLFFVGDEGRGVVEISRTGQTIGNNLFNWAGTVKQDNPAQLRIFNSLPFATAAAADLVPNIAFSGTSALFGLNSLSDVQTLAPVDALLGTAAADNLLVLSLDSRKLIEIDRLGNIKSMLDLSGIVPFNAIEGVTIDENGVIYLIAEQDQRTGAPANSRSQLIVLTAVPEPETYAMMLAGLGLLGFVAARRRQTS